MAIIAIAPCALDERGVFAFTLDTETLSQECTFNVHHFVNGENTQGELTAPRTVCPGDGRQYTINNDNVAKSAEKLSSGYRINRAGDDAAGLAISEKMRSQIRGLTMAAKNSQDAISLVQTAEGALQETQNMLQRMNELAVQAATGTNQEIDRNALAKEFEQLKREINDVAEQTTFNNMKILDGSLSNSDGYVRSAQTAGITVTSSELSGSIPKGIDATNQATAGVTAGAAGTAGEWELTVDNTLSFTSDGSTGTATVAVTIDGTTTNLTVSIAGLSSNSTWGALSSGDKGAATISGAPAGYTASISNAGVITLTQAQPTAATGTVPAVTGAGWGQTVAPVKAGGAAVAEVSTATVSTENLKAGDKFTIGDKTYVLTDDDHTADTANGETGIAWKEAADKTVAKLIDGINAAAPTGLTVAAVGTDGFSVTQTNGTGKDDTTNYVDTSIKFTPAQADDSVYKNTIEIDAAKLKDGDKIEVTLGGETATVTFDSTKYDSNKTETASQQIAKEIADQLTAAGVTVTQKGNAVTFEGAKVDPETQLKLTDITKDNDEYATNAIRIQVGALEDEQLSISIEAMNTAGLGLDKFNLDTQNEAGMAITAVRDAINKVSDQRATLGAMQNRLEHKIANLNVSTENLSAAESRIRDVDMASEMTNFTKNNILSQAATAMLAQANALPQNVLSLLG